MTVPVALVLARCLRAWKAPAWIGEVSTERRIVYYDGWRAMIQAALKDAKRAA